MNLPKREFRNADNIRRVLRLLIFTFGVLGIAGALGAGYCDHQLRLAPRIENVKEGEIAPREYKGEQRFVTHTGDVMCSLSIGMTFVGSGAACFFAFLYFFWLGGRVTSRR